MKKFVYFFVLFFIFHNTKAQIIKVACVGNSVTFGAGIENRGKDSYPSQLQKLLGSKYEVENFGFSGATMLKKGHKPYWDTAEFKASKKFEPNIVIIHLGLNDQGNNNWPFYQKEFKADYLGMIAEYRSLPSKPKVFICRMTPTFSGHHWFQEGMRENFIEIQSEIEKIAALSNTELIDLHDPLYRFPEYFPDNLHPKKEGAAVIAQKAYRAITGDFGGLQVSPLYGEKMVLQRNEPVVFSGIANADDKVSINFNQWNKITKAATNGTWEISFPEMKAGGPYSLKIETQNSGNKFINEVYLGEVWLASGQSNMDFRVQQMESAATVLKDSLSDNIFVFSMDGKVATTNKAFSEEELKFNNSKDYFSYSGWSNQNDETLQNFSAIAYSFAYQLQKELKIPIGIICNAIGGSPTQSWISREQMETKHQTVGLLNDTHLHPMVDSWVSERREKNFENQNTTGVLARHPYDPTLLFDAGIYPIKNYTIKGVLWYQGESNADQIDLHSELFKLLVSDWRMHWNKPEMPFYYVQLSSIERNGWGEFRDAQRRLLSIPFTGMATSYDVGDKTDVHPTKKWVVGERLSKIALAKTYGFNTKYSGPLFDFVNVNGNKLAVHFSHNIGLQTINNEAVKDIFIAGADKIFVPATTAIDNDILEVWSSEIKNPRYIKYGYSPYSDGNLMNNAKLFAPTFSNLPLE
tara:strand:- start:34735 stop:36813 length:2079 start_codon:yes stop_codon:yes gene_type:complete